MILIAPMSQTPKKYTTYTLTLRDVHTYETHANRIPQHVFLENGWLTVNHDNI